MARLPISRVVDVSLTRQDNFATRAGFGVPLIITTLTVAGEVDATARTKVYGSIDEVSEDWNSSTAVYKSALAVFSQNPRPRQLKVGHVVPGVIAETPTAQLDDQMDLVYGYDPDWYWLTITSELRDEAALDDLIAWIEAKSRIALIDSNDAGTENPANTTSIAARNKGQFERTAIFYHPSADAQLAAAAVGYLARRDFDNREGAYTLKFKGLSGQEVVNKGSAVVQAVTGFVPGIGLDAAQGHLANTFVNIGGVDMLLEGCTLTGAFIDEIHASDWIVARTEEELLSRLANNDRIPMTNEGMQILVGGVEAVMNRAEVTGLVAGQTDPETGDEVDAFEIFVERVEDLPAAQRKQRIAPAIDCQFRYAGAVHYSTVRFSMTF